jgi:hypothetical protein
VTSLMSPSKCSFFFLSMAALAAAALAAPIAARPATARGRHVRIAHAFTNQGLQRRHVDTHTHTHTHTHLLAMISHTAVEQHHSLSNKYQSFW